MSELSREDMQSALFVQLVMQQANMAMMLMGKIPNPETQKPMRDLEAARVFIDQIEMLEVKTKGNLNANEAALLQQTLMSLRMGFVEAVNEPTPKMDAESGAGDEKIAAQNPAEDSKEKSSPAESTSEESSGKRFSKKY